MDTRTITHADHTDTETLFGEVWAVTACNCELVTKSIEQTGVDNMPNTSDECLNCGGEYGLHHCSTDQCPVGGREAPVGRKQEWKTTTFQAAPKQDAAQSARIAELEAQNKRLVEALKSLLGVFEINVRDCDTWIQYRNANILLAELSK